MATRHGKRHQTTIDGQTVWLDSLNEAIALQRFIDIYGFSGKWARPTYGIKHQDKYYSPDFELAIDDAGNTARALIEVKEYRRNFTKDMAVRMSAVASHYHTDHTFLYATKTDSWFQLIRRTGEVLPCIPPQAGKLVLSELVKPASFVTYNRYGRRYRQSFVDGLFSFLYATFVPTKPKCRRR